MLCIFDILITVLLRYEAEELWLPLVHPTSTEALALTMQPRECYPTGVHPVTVLLGDIVRRVKVRERRRGKDPNTLRRLFVWIRFTRPQAEPVDLIKILVRPNVETDTWDVRRQNPVGCSLGTDLDVTRRVDPV